MYPVLKDKRFVDQNGNIITVADQFDDVAVLSTGNRISINRLLDKTYYDEYIDPKTFFGDTYNVFAEKIKSIPMEDLDKIKEESIDSPAIMTVDPDEERREMEEKARRMSVNPNVEAQKQIEKMREILGDDDDLPAVVNIPEVNNNINEPPVQRIVAPSVQSVIDPITTMFKNVKRNKDFNFTISIDEKIPRLDFIEMMEDSYEASIIDFLADEFTQKILSNPNYIKSIIVNGIKDLVYPNKTEDKNDLELINDMPSEPLEPINDGSTQIKKKRSTKKSSTTND